MSADIRIERFVKIGVVTGTLLLSGLALRSLSFADHQTQRLDRLAEQTKSLAASPRPELPQPAAAPCKGPLAGAVEEALSESKRQAAVAGLDIVKLDATEPVASLPTDLHGQGIVMELHGSEVGLTRFIQAMAVHGGPIFIEEAMLTRQTDGDMSFAVAAKILCRRGY